MTSSFSTLLTSSLAQILDLVPTGLHGKLLGIQIAVAAIALLYLVLPSKAKITLEWER
ncbi:hypothetical protein Rhe02_52260 [Rhizocola hellebori]|uniref:Uncharacterized protein n=1 Tax=Rhizocola hellebori TaxID=1392758 RepID=A0A8J3QC09_9ACTN|nr:hypothetical protein [Rhizocola hellebori]GIH07159.1 hypothetical protein Rhe02_52260 [Rhizocola hellebori]